MVRTCLMSIVALVPAFAGFGCAAATDPAAPVDDKNVTESYGSDWNRNHGTSDPDMTKFDDGSFLMGGW